MFRLSGWKNAKQFGGSGQINSNWVNWTAEFANGYADKITDKKEDRISVGQVMYPFTAYGNIQAPKQQEILITNTTVWTNEKDGVLKNYDVLISNGKIIKMTYNEVFEWVKKYIYKKMY